MHKSETIEEDTGAEAQCLPGCGHIKVRIHWRPQSKTTHLGIETRVWTGIKY